MTDTAVIFGTQRSGSNFYLSACRKFDGLTVLGEMYHRGGAFPFQSNDQHDFAIKQRLGGIICGMFAEHVEGMFDGWSGDAEFTPESNASINAAIVRFSHKMPVRYFDALRELAGGERLIFKIFPEHLELAQMLSLLRERRPAVILLMRDPLESFISFKKLTETKKPQGFDTSSLKIRFNPVEYFVYKAAVTSYFRTIREYCVNEELDLFAVHYEWLHNDTDGNKVERIRGQLERAFRERVQLAEDADVNDLFKRQDKSESAAQKVLNPSQLPRSPQSILCD